MEYKIEIHGKGTEFFIYPLTESQNETLKSNGIQEGGMKHEDISQFLQIDDFCIEGTTAVYTDHYYIRVFDNDENLIWESEVNPFPETSQKNFENPSEFYLLIDDYQKGHFFDCFLECDGFNPIYLEPILTEYLDGFCVVKDFKYKGVVLEKEMRDTWSKGYTYYLK